MVYAQRYEGRFCGRRVNCEQVPLLPARSVARIFDDPKETPYLLVWKSSSGTIEESVRIAPHNRTDTLEIKRDDGTTDIIRTLLRPLPRNGGSVRLLICPRCQTPRRGLYGWEPGGRLTTSAVSSVWSCRVCNRLRYASEGGSLVQRGRGRIFDRLFETTGRCRSDRPAQWLPYVFTTPEEAAQVEH